MAFWRPNLIPRPRLAAFWNSSWILKKVSSWGHPASGWGHSRGPHPPSETHIAPASSFLAPCLVRACPSMNWANKRRRPVCWHADDKRTLVVPMSNTKHDHDNVLKICLCFWICDDISHLILHWFILYIEYTFCNFIVITTKLQRNYKGHCINYNETTMKLQGNYKETTSTSWRFIAVSLTVCCNCVVISLQLHCNLTAICMQVVENTWTHNNFHKDPPNYN